MSENSLTFLPLDDPEPKVAKHVIEKGYDGSEKTALKGTSYQRTLGDVLAPPY